MENFVVEKLKQAPSCELKPLRVGAYCGTPGYLSQWLGDRIDILDTYQFFLT